MVFIRRKFISYYITCLLQTYVHADELPTENEVSNQVGVVLVSILLVQPIHDVSLSFRGTLGDVISACAVPVYMVRNGLPTKIQHLKF